MKIGITGATGFLGGALARRLASEGHEIHALARSSSDRGNMQDVEVIWHEGDINEPATLKPFTSGLDQLINAAGILGQAGVSEAEYRQINVNGVRNLLESVAATSPDARVLQVSSAGVLGPVREGQTAEDFNEHAIPAPSNPYERSKTEAEAVAREFAINGLDVVIVRPEFVYGPGDRHVLGLFKAIQRGLFFYCGDGQNRCHPTFVDDAVEGMMLVLERGDRGDTYLIVGPRPVTFRDFAGTIAATLGVRQPWLRLPEPLARAGAAGLEILNRLTGVPIPLTRTGVDFFSEERAFTNRFTQEKLGYVPRIDLREGVERTVSWYRQEGYL